jgi:hypothetical protein
MRISRRPRSPESHDWQIQDEADWHEEPFFTVVTGAARASAAILGDSLRLAAPQVR